MFSIFWFIGGPLIYFAAALFLAKTVSTILKYSKGVIEDPTIKHFL